MEATSPVPEVSTTPLAFLPGPHEILAPLNPLVPPSPLNPLNPKIPQPMYPLTAGVEKTLSSWFASPWAMTAVIVVLVILISLVIYLMITCLQLSDLAHQGLEANRHTEIKLGQNLIAIQDKLAQLDKRGLEVKVDGAPGDPKSGEGATPK